MLDIDTAGHALKDSGERLTPQRIFVIEALIGNRSHPTVEQIFEVVKLRYPTITHATIYQTVALLVRHGLLLQLHGGKDGLRYDPDITPHAHGYCDCCGKVFDLPLNDIIQLDQLADHQFVPERVEMTFYGKCSECLDL